MGIKVNLSGVRTKVSPEAMRRGRYESICTTKK